MITDIFLTMGQTNKEKEEQALLTHSRPNQILSTSKLNILISMFDFTINFTYYINF